MAGRGQAHQLKQFLGGRGFKASASWTGCPGSRRSEQRNPLSGLRQPWWPMKVLIPLFTPVATLTSMIHAVHRSLPALLLLPAFKTGERRQAADRAAPFLGNRRGASSSSTTFIVYGYRYYLPELGRWPSRDPIGESGGGNLYQMTGNAPIALTDYLGLDAGAAGMDASECCLKNGKVVGRKVTDDAGVKCCPDELTTITLESDVPAGISPGHVWLDLNPKDTKRGAFGFYPSDIPLVESPGKVDSDDWRGGPSGKSRTYKVCHETKSKLKSSIGKHAADWFSLDNAQCPGRNCAGWASDRLGDAGLDAPIPLRIPLGGPLTWK